MKNDTTPQDAAGATDRRAVWHRQRIRMERLGEKHTPNGRQATRHWDLFKVLLGAFDLGLKLTGLHERGVRNALNIKLTCLELAFTDLPAAFDGFRILQISDPHVDFLPATTEIARGLAKDLDPDICVITGDFKRGFSGPFDHILPALRDLISGISARHGVLGILGNHDTADMVEALEDLGIRILVNETRTIERDGARIHFTGTDDVHYFYTDAARHALAEAPGGFKVALVHSPELAGVAADRGTRLYLAGHTHGGQVCFPGGRPVITHLTCHRGYASGLWRHGTMVGYTSTGVGVSALPVRFNSRGEIVLITLRRQEQA